MSGCANKLALGRIRLLKCMLQTALVASFFVASATAEIKRLDRSTILLEGPIASGDFDRLVELSAEMIAENNELPETSVTKMFAVRLRLNSPGGDVAEAFKIADFVREMWIHTEVSDPSVVRQIDKDGEILQKESASRGENFELGGEGPIICYSACSLIFLAGIPRSYLPSTLGRSVELGFHRPYLDPGVNRQLTPDESRSVYLVLEASFKEAMRRYGAPESLIMQTFNASSADINILSKEQFDAIFPLEEPWFAEYINAKCGSVRTTGGFKTKEETQAHVKSVTVRAICSRWVKNEHQRSKIRDYIVN